MSISSVLRRRSPARRQAAAFTLIELLITAAVSTVLGGIIYVVASEALFSFARNWSINRSYSSARLALDRIGQNLQSAGYKPSLVNEDGTAFAPSTGNPSQAAGLRFYRSGATPSYAITAGAAAGATMTVSYPAAQGAPGAGDLIFISSVGFQGKVQSVSAPTLVSGVATAILTFTGTLASNCTPAPTGEFNPVLTGQSCLDYNQVAFIAVSQPAQTSAADTTQATSTELRYYPNATDLTRYKVLANLVLDQSATRPNPVVPDATKPPPAAVANEELATHRPRPFLLGQSPTVLVKLCAEGPEYNKRNLGSANTFTVLQTSLGSRCPLILRPPTF